MASTPALSPLYALSALDQRPVDQLTQRPDIARSKVVARPTAGASVRTRSNSIWLFLAKYVPRFAAFLANE